MPEPAFAERFREDLQPPSPQEEATDEGERQGRRILLGFISLSLVMAAVTQPLTLHVRGERLSMQLTRLALSFALYYFLYKGSRVAKWITVVGNTIAAGIFLLLIRHGDPLAIVLGGGLAAFILSFTWALIWSRRVNDFLESQGGRTWSEAGGVITFLLLGTVGLAATVLPHFFVNGSAPWKYHSPGHNLTLALPSGDWKEVKMEGSDVAFINRKHTVLAGVNVAQGREGDYEVGVRETRAYFQRSANELLREPQFTEGVTPSGHAYSTWTVTAKAKNDSAVFLARSLVWCENKGLIVSVIIEGPLAMRSQTGRESELEFYHRSVKAITSSIE